MRVLVTGYQGQLGYDIMKEAERLGVEAVGVGRNELDVTDREQVQTVLHQDSYDAVIHCAAWVAVDKAEEEIDMARAVNYLGTKYIAEECGLLDIPLMYFSTDYVFDGKGEEFFNENDQPQPINIYGLTKYEGEKEVMKLSKYFIIRISWLFGYNGNNFIKTMIRLSDKQSEVNIVNDQIGSPTYTKDLSVLALEMIQTNSYGIYHASNQGVCSWYDFAKEIFRQSQINVKVNPITSDELPTKAKRPHNSRLGQTNLDKNGFKRLPGWEDALARYLKEIDKI